jgi:hypothetical protein
MTIHQEALTAFVDHKLETYHQEAERAHLTARPVFRARLARLLHALAERLEPTATPERSYHV